MPAFRNNEPVRVCDSLYATIVCTLDYQRDDIEQDDTGAVVLLYPQFIMAGESAIIEVSMADLSKQYDI